MALVNEWVAAYHADTPAFTFELVADAFDSLTRTRNRVESLRLAVQAEKIMCAEPRGWHTKGFADDALSVGQEIVQDVLKMIAAVNGGLTGEEGDLFVAVGGDLRDL